LLGLEALSEAGRLGRRLVDWLSIGGVPPRTTRIPGTSHAWQLGEAQRFVEPLRGVVVAEYFDIGQSRSLPWERRDMASQILKDLKNPARGWDGSSTRDALISAAGRIGLSRNEAAITSGLTAGTRNPRSGR
jgi:hypothetical protein